MADLVDVPLAETTLAFDVEVISGSTVLRTWSSVSAESLVYTGPEQAADGIAPGAPVDARVYQLGAYGRGFPSEVTV